MNPLRLGINIDHVATLRNARGGNHPCPIRAALVAQEAGADGITAHLREDRRHIRDHDIERLRHEVPLPLNLEMAATEEMLGIALKVKPHAVCLVPEKREELTTEGGLDVRTLQKKLKTYVGKLQDAGIRVSLFIAPEKIQIDAAKATQTDIVELHTGTYAEFFPHRNAKTREWQQQLANLYFSADYAHQCELEVHAGHGLDYENVHWIAALPHVRELNIGHFLMGEALFVGMKESIMRMKQVILSKRSESKDLKDPSAALGMTEK